MGTSQGWPKNVSASRRLQAARANLYREERWIWSEVATILSGSDPTVLSLTRSQIRSQNTITNSIVTSIANRTKKTWPHWHHRKVETGVSEVRLHSKSGNYRISRALALSESGNYGTLRVLARSKSGNYRILRALTLSKSGNYSILRALARA